MDRRDFFQLLTIGAIGAQINRIPFALGQGGYSNPSKFKSSYFVNFYGEGTIDQSVRIYDIFTEDLIKVPIDFAPHTMTRITENILVCSKKYGANAAVIDIKKGKVICSHEYAPNDYMQYMGHCLFDEKKGVIYTTEQMHSERIDSNHRKGVVHVRDPFTLKILGTHESYGYSPHDLLFTNDGNIALCNTADKDLPYDKGQSFWSTEYRNVSLINSSDFSLIKKIAMPNPYFCPGHIKKFEDKLVVTGVYGHLPDLEFAWAETNWNPVIIDKDGNTTELLQGSYVHDLMNTEHLSIAVNENAGVVGITIPRCNSVNFWSLKDNSFLGHLNFVLPVGILVHPVHGDFMVVTDRGVHRVNPRNFQSQSQGMYFMGNDMSHSYII